MSRDLDLSAGGVIDGTETIEEVGAPRVRARVARRERRGAGARRGHKHREFQVWAEQSVSL